MTDAINMRPEEKGGIGMILPFDYLRYLHSKRYVNWMKSPGSLTGAQLRSFGECRRGPTRRRRQQEALVKETSPKSGRQEKRHMYIGQG